VKKEITYLIIQFILFTLFFIEWDDALEFSYPTWLNFVVFSIVAVGILIIVFGILNLNNNINPFDKSEEIKEFVFVGIYNYIRHPIYLGIGVLMLSFAFYSQSLIKLFITLLLGIIFYFKSSHEEKLLVKSNSDYKKYKEKTGRFFPKFNNSKS
jgi:protein-S-isoprenylcysteine O-methyltransferase Ste14